jgi:hypothetical protein
VTVDRRHGAGMGPNMSYAHGSERPTHVAYDTMKTTLLLLGLLGLLGFSLPVGTDERIEPAKSTTATDSAVPVTLRRTGVRAEYVSRDRTLGQIDTDIVIQNTNAAWPFTIRNIIVLGRRGLNTTLIVNNRYRGGVVPTLGTLVIPVSSLGVTAGKHTPTSPRDVSMVVVETDDRGFGQVRVSAVVKQWEPSNSTNGHFATRLEEGFPLKIN